MKEELASLITPGPDKYKERRFLLAAFSLLIASISLFVVPGTTLAEYTAFCSLMLGLYFGSGYGDRTIARDLAGSRK